MKKGILIVLLLITSLNVNAKCEAIYKKIFIDKIHKINENGESLEGVKFTLHDIENEISFNYNDEGQGRYSLILYHKKNYCSPGNEGTAYQNKNIPTIKKLSETITVEDAGDKISELILAEVSTINYINEWNEKIPGFYKYGYDETTSGNQTTRKTHILYPMILEEKSIDGYLPADKYIIVLSGTLTNSYYTNGYIYEKSFEFEEFFYSWAPYFRYDSNYDYSKMYMLDHDEWDEFYDEYVVNMDNEENCFEDCRNEEAVYGSIKESQGIKAVPLACQNVCEDIHKIKNIRETENIHETIHLDINNSINDNQKTSVNIGEPVKYKTIIKNNSNTTTNNVIVKTKVPEEMEYIENSASFDGKYDNNTRIITWTIDKLSGNETKTLEYIAIVNKKINDTNTIQLYSTATSDEAQEEIKTKEAVIEVSEEKGIIPIYSNPKMGALISITISLLSIFLLFSVNYLYFKRKNKVQ